MELLTLWLWPLVALVVLPAMLVYFGLHVVGRGIIFVDLALAQIAALGIATAILFGADPDHSSLPYALAIVFTLAGAALFSLTRFRHPRVPQEAIIGILYIVAAAAATLVLSRTAAGDEEIKNLLVGNIPWSPPARSCARSRSSPASGSSTSPCGGSSTWSRSTSKGPSARGSASGSGTSSSTPRSAWW
jgi:ABC-type Mn2+/Zn2+ transport system permease subunit